MKKIQGGLIVTMFLASLATVINPVYAQDHVHNIDTGEDFSSLQAAIGDGDTQDGHTIVIDACTLDEWNITVTKSVTIQGDGAAATIIDGNNNGRVLTVTNGITVTISGLTITNGNVSGSSVYGGGIYNGGTLTVQNCTIVSNALTVTGSLAYARGGGIYNNDTLTMTNCTISGNTPTAMGSTLGGVYGGGISNSGTLTVQNCTIVSNTANGNDYVYGGGIYNDGTIIIIENTTISNNTPTTAIARGGGIYNDGTINAIEDTTISGNTAYGTPGNGGGISNSGTITIIEDTTISGNTSFNIGGGIYNNNTLTIIKNCTISGNTVNGTNASGGGIYNYWQCSLTVQNCTVSGNTASSAGGGIYNYQAEATVNAKNTIIGDNTATYGPDFFGPLNTVGYNLIENTSSIVGYVNPGTDITGVDPLLGPLQNNGGPTMTHALLLGSPAIGTGDCTDIGGSPVLTDQRGAARPQGLGCDIGAYEAGPDGSVTKTVDNASPHIGDDVIFTIVVTNNGPITANNVVVTDLLPAGLLYFDDDSGGSYDSTTGVWNIGPLVNFESRTLHITATVTQAGTITNTATQTQNEYDPDTNNDSSSVTLEVPVPVNCVTTFMPVRSYHLAQVNAYLECITESLPEDMPGDIQELLDEMQEHIDNANTTGNSIYANNELLKALDCCETIREILGIACP